MSFIDKAMVKDIGDFPHKRGSYEVENYLLGGDGAVNAGCWIYDKTVYGDMKLGSQNWATYSTPVLAYLAHLNTVRVPSSVKYIQDVAVTEGYSSTFTSTLETEIGLGSGFLGCVIGGKLTSSSSEGIYGSTVNTRKIEMEGPGVFNIYQLHYVYAHCVTSAGNFGDFFEYSKCQKIKNREDLFFLTSLASETTVAVASKYSIAPLGWGEIQIAALMDGYNAEFNSGRFAFDWKARNLPGCHY
ncbi:monalysin family beta-barrel pore-forming toxin [Pseudomonas sp. CM25]|uniref:monalysin family beta-barrel pore-forming toxin n=1 Tax=Pseudomonas sp. CM25 TaxID=2738448 RepID=UPI00155462E1|nr:monalysin family beta-barrel pore-forming toxin [Pseudomonas sp. CM25]NQD55077.1 monalysin family beta-barrel pore-forming toxin [Pseudomonas sp. CM25]